MLAWILNLGFAAGGVADTYAQTASATLAMSVVGGDKFRVRIKRATGSTTATTVADASGLTIWKVSC